MSFISTIVLSQFQTQNQTEFVVGNFGLGCIFPEIFGIMLHILGLFVPPDKSKQLLRCKSLVSICRYFGLQPFVFYFLKYFVFSFRLQHLKTSYLNFNMEWCLQFNQIKGSLVNLPGDG
jgi:hypothetical protein